MLKMVQVKLAPLHTSDMLLQAKQQAQDFIKFVGLIEQTEIQMLLEINHML